MKNEEQMDLFKSHKVSQAVFTRLQKPLPEIENMNTGKRYALLRITEHCNAPNCTNPRPDNRVTCMECWFNGWREK